MQKQSRFIDYKVLPACISECWVEKVRICGEHSEDPKLEPCTWSIFQPMTSDAEIKIKSLKWINVTSLKNIKAFI